MTLFGKTLLFLSCLTFQSSAAASAATAINGNISCDSVVRSVGLSINEHGKVSDEKSFYCVVDPVYTSTGTNGVRLKLLNLPSTFERDWKRVTADGKDQSAGGLNLREVVIEGQTNLRLPDHSSTTMALEEDTNANLSPKEGVDQCIVPLLSWKINPPSTAGNLSSESDEGRNLAVNQSGVKTVLVVRITSSTYESPTNTAAEMSDAVFTGDLVTMKSQYEACSYGALTLQHATNSVNGLSFSANGVVDISVTTSATTYTDAIRELARAALGTSTSDDELDGIDHILYVMPPGTETESGGGTSWVAFADFPGNEGTYNDDSIIDVQTLVHETGHNLGLDHSGDVTYTGTAGTEYGDVSCYMGYTTGSVNLQKCFNAAKMVELGWYDASKMVAINGAYQEFDGKVIGVNDHAIASSDYSLVVQILSADATAGSYYLTYNKAEGINAGTNSGPNEIRIVEGGSSEQSWLIASLTPGSSYTFADFYNGRDLIITTSAEASVGEVNYIPLTIALETVPCTTLTDCGTPTCFTATCNSGGVCEYSAASNCCGNGICETGESCSDCTSDCRPAAGDCSEIDAVPDSSVFGSYNTGAYGIKFNVEVTTDISFYEVEADLTVASGQVQAKVYTKVGSYGAAGESLANWDLVFDGTSSSAPSYDNIGSMPFDTPQFSESGSTRAFYISYTSGAQYYYFSGGAVFTNADASVQLATTVAALTGTTMPNDYHSDEKQFFGGLKYDYPRAATSPTMSPSPSKEPTKAPVTGTTAPTISSAPSRLPTKAPVPATSSPTKSSSPSASPTKAPTRAPTVCGDVDTYTFTLNNGKQWNCAYFTKKLDKISSRRGKYCFETDGTASAIGLQCQDGCGFCSGDTLSPATTTSPTKAPSIACAGDNTYTFTLNSGKQKDCAWFTKKWNKISSRRGKYCFETDGTASAIGLQCQAGCGLCSGDTLSPAKAPTRSPSVGCYDNASFTFNLDNGKLQNCAWLTKTNPDTRINKYCPRDVIQGACQASCSSCA